MAKKLTITFPTELVPNWLEDFAEQTDLSFNEFVSGLLYGKTFELLQGKKSFSDAKSVIDEWGETIQWDAY